MKLKNIIAPLQQNLRKTISLLRFNPFQKQGRRAIANSLLNRGRRKLENLEIPQGKSAAFSQSNILVHAQEYIFEPLANLYPQYAKCDRHNPLGCDRPLEILKQVPSAKFCSQCGFPAQLPHNKELRGKRGRYRIIRFLGRQGNGRIYEATQQHTGQSIVIKEYLLPSLSFKSEATRQQKKDLFARIANFQVAATSPADFRLIIPQEGILDRSQDRCYLITSSNLASLPNLKAYLLQQGRMQQQEVLTLLEQVLQSLEFLHSHRWQFTSGVIQQGLVHGNLSLDSLLISQTEVGFLVYLWDLACWEELFNPQVEQVANQKVVDDLVALGNIGLYLLAAKEITAQASYPLNPRNDSNWQGIPSPVKNFLLKLIGLDSPFLDAATARRELRQLKLNFTNLESIPEKSWKTEDAEDRNSNWLLWGLVSATIVLLGGVMWKIITKKPPLLPSVVNCIEDVENVPHGTFTYATVASERLTDIFQINQTYKNAHQGFCSINSNSENFTNIIKQIHQINLISSNIFNSQESLLSKLDPFTLNSALIKLNPHKDLNKTARDQEFFKQIIAYDGLLVYVPFVECTNCEQMGSYLEQKITLSQLRDIYQGKVDYWHEIDPNIPKNIKIQAFIPKDDYAIEVFKQLVFADKQEEISKFLAALDGGKIIKPKNYSTLIDIRELWEQDNPTDSTKIGAIGFDFQSIAYKQCNGYPLAVVRNSAEFFPMLISKEEGTGINLFKELDCKNDKDDYQLNEEVFRNGQYPLAFSLNLLYLNDDRQNNLKLGDKLTAIFQTKEFQCHLSHKKFIPRELSEKDCK